VILVILTAFIVLVPLAIWRDWLDDQAVNNPELHLTIIRIINIIGALAFIWIMYQVINPEPARIIG
tara:strand:+ start:255 stop:452 length:198 start_codon:yes stop_codon:yes gene_type:complete